MIFKFWYLKFNAYNKWRHQNKSTFQQCDSKDYNLHFQWNVSASIPTEPAFWSAQLMFSIIWFSKQKLSGLKQWFYWRTLQVIFPGNITYLIILLFPPICMVIENTNILLLTKVILLSYIYILAFWGSDIFTEKV